jgi:hypothetical protein
LRIRKTAMADTATPVKSRRFRRTDAKRTFVSVVLLAIVGVCYWFLLPAIQSQIIPSGPGGRTGPWVLRPIFAFHFGAVAVMACVTVAVIVGRLKRKWEREDAALGTRYDPLSDRPMKRVFVAFAACLLFLVYAAALVFYLLSWTIIGPDGIEQRLPWGTLHHSFQDIESLETIPDGERSESLRQNGPWYAIKLRSGRSITLSTDNEGLTSDELSALTSFVADRSGLVWVRRSDARVR